MAQAFITTYKSNYRWYEPEKLVWEKWPQFEEILPKGKWIKPDRTRRDGQIFEEGNIKEMYKARMVTTYKNDYCRDSVSEAGAEDGDIQGILHTAGKKLYHPKKQAILPPLFSSRRLYGFIPFCDLKTPLSTYQCSHGLTSYKILKRTKRAQN